MTSLQHAELLSITMKMAADEGALAPALGANVGQLAGLGAAVQSLSNRPLGMESAKGAPAAMKPVMDLMRTEMLKRYPMGSMARMSEVVRTLGPKGVVKLLFTYGLLGAGGGALGGYGIQKGYQALRGEQ